MKTIKDIALSGLVDLVPYGLGSTINNIITEIQSRRLRTFLDQAANGETQLTQEIIEKEDFLHNYFATVSAVINTRRIEKIRLFGNLFNKAVYTNTILNTDEYEFFLKILDELTFIEIELLSSLDEFESTLGSKSMSRREKQKKIPGHGQNLEIIVLSNLIFLLNRLMIILLE